LGNLSCSSSISSIAFIVTKPLQFLIATALKNQLDARIKFKLLIINSFDGSESVSAKVVDSGLGWDSASYYQTKREAMQSLYSDRVDSVFIDSDVGFSNYVGLSLFKARFLATNIYVYEEGTGSYRDNLYSGVKSFFFKMIGCGTAFGHSLPVSGIWLYKPEKFKKKFKRYRKQIHKIEKSVFRMTVENTIKLSELFNGAEIYSKINRKQNNCALYLTSWTVDKDFLKKFIDISGDKYIKPHPHLIDSQLDSSQLNSVELPSGAPAEILILAFSEKYDVVYVYHHGSSLEEYVQEFRNVVFVKI